MTKTTNYQLPKWEKTDRIQMKDFNDMTATLDAALKANADAIAAEAIAREAGDAALQSAVCLPMHAFLLPKTVPRRPPPAGGKAGPRRRAWLRSPRFWLLVTTFVFSMFATAAISVHVIALVVDRGLSAREAVYLAARRSLLANRAAATTDGQQP